MFDQEQQAVESRIRDFCIAQGLPDPDPIHWNPIPFSGRWGISTSFFQLAAREPRTDKHKSVPQRAQEIASSLASYLGIPGGFGEVEAVKGYLNLFFSTEEFSRRVIERIQTEGAKYGRGPHRDEVIMVEFSNPNTHKAFHVGHLRSAILGDSICRILEFAGYTLVRANYIGDIGLHVIMWLWNYMKYHTGETPPTDTTRWMGELYAEANHRIEENPELETEVRALYTRWDQGDPEIVALWEETRRWSVEHFHKMYQLLDIHFDRWYSNSEVEEPGKQVVKELITNGIATDERATGGPVIVRIDDLLGLNKEKYRVLVVLRSDNTALYATLDLALAIKKFAEYDLDRSIYVVDVRQSLHFQQVFKTLEIAGYVWAPRCQHLPYEVVSLPGNVVMASREGTIVLLEQLLQEAMQRARVVVEEKNPDLPSEKKQEVASAVGLGALKYPMLARDNTKIVTFDWETALDFNGQAAPYIQYAHVRANSILKRMESLLPSPFTPTYQFDPTEVHLIDLISRFPAEVQRAAMEQKTLVITNFAYELARAFNDFYNQCPVLKAEPSIRDFRLGLVDAARQTLANSLGLLGIAAPDVM